MASTFPPIALHGRDNPMSPDFTPHSPHTECVCGHAREQHEDNCLRCLDCDGYRPNEETEPDCSGSWL